MKTACCYLRVSTSQQDADNQLPAIKAWCESHGYELTEVYRETESAWRQGHQHELKRLLDDLRAGKRKYDCVTVWALDRLCRQGIGSLLQLINTFEVHGCHVVSVSESWTQDVGQMRELFLAFAGWAAKFESDRRSQRTLAGLDRAIANGKVLGRPRGAKDRKKKAAQRLFAAVCGKMKMTEAMAIPKFDKDGLDLEIREIVIRLNASGFITFGSCAGHQDCPPGHGDRGFISFELGYNHAAIIEALTWYGLKNIAIEEHHNNDNDDFMAATFDPIGFPISDWWISQVVYCEEAHIANNGADYRRS